MRMIGAIALLVASSSMPPAVALSLENLAPPLSVPGQPDPPELPAGATSWDTLGKATVVFSEANGEETVTTIIPPEVDILDGKPVTLMGFMFPIDAEPKLQRFLLVEYPVDCPFCFAGTVEPSRMVAVEAGKPMDWHDEAVVLAGRLEVVRNDADGLVYRLHDAQLAP